MSIKAKDDYPESALTFASIANGIRDTQQHGKLDIDKFLQDEGISLSTTLQGSLLFIRTSDTLGLL